jgi:hypothetical protein
MSNVEYAKFNNMSGITSIGISYLVNIKKIILTQCNNIDFQCF